MGEDALAETLAEARDNATFSSPEAWVGLPEPDGVPPVLVDRWRDELAGFPAAHKVTAALDLERAVRAGDPRVRQVESANWGDAFSEKALASSLGVQASDRSTACYLSAVAVAGEGAESQVASGFSVGRALPSSTRPKSPVTPSSGPCGSWGRPNLAPPVCRSYSSPG